MVTCNQIISPLIHLLTLVLACVVSLGGILSEYCRITATVSRDSWISFRDNLSIEDSRCSILPSEAISMMPGLSSGEVRMISGWLRLRLLLPGLPGAWTTGWGSHSSMMGASLAQKLWDFSRPFLQY